MKTERAAPSTDTEDDDQSFDFSHIIHTLRRKWWVLPTCLLFTLGFGILYIIVTPYTYRSEETIEVEQSDTKILNIEDLKAEDLKQDTILKTFEQNLLSGDVLSRVIQELKLTPAQLQLKPREKNRGDYLLGEQVDALNKMCASKLERGTRLIDVSADSTDPSLAQKIATSVVSQYVQSDVAQRNGVSAKRTAFCLSSPTN